LSSTFPILPTILPLGDSAVLVRFGDVLGDAANRAAIAFARTVDAEPVAGVLEVVPNLVSVMLRYDPWKTGYESVAGEIRLRIGGLETAPATDAGSWSIETVFDGPDLDDVAASLGLSPEDFVAAHARSDLRVLATGFAPGFVYCGLHPENMVLPRRSTIRPKVAAGSVLFAAGQTAIAATDMPTGWHVIGRTDFRNFDPAGEPPTRLAAGDRITFVPTA
jgi:KipI family sensor histidine kinase inhibitor